jgi:Domain of unknown function (DUF4340)
VRAARATIVLGLLAAASLGLAVWLNRPPAPPPVAAGAGQPFVPGAAELAARASEIQLHAAAAKVTLQKGENGWNIAEKDGYPADGRKVTELLEGFARAEKVAAKSPEQARFARMGLGEDATTLSLYDDGGALLFSLDLGTQFPEAASGRLLTYAFFEGMPRAWTVSGLPRVAADPMFWADPEILSLSPARVKRVKVAFGAKQGISLSRTEASGLAFNARELEGKSADPDAVNALAFALQHVEAEDVAKAGTLELFEVASAVFTAFDGLEVTARFSDHEGVVWASFAAAYRPEVLEEADTPRVLPDAPADGAAEAAELNARLEGWLYRLPLAAVSAILKTEETLGADSR